MDLLRTLEQRKSVRAFLDQEVEKEKIRKILTASSQAPSGTNMQP